MVAGKWNWGKGWARQRWYGAKGGVFRQAGIISTQVGATRDGPGIEQNNGVLRSSPGNKGR